MPRPDMVFGRSIKPLLQRKPSAAALSTLSQNSGLHSFSLYEAIGILPF